MKFLSLKFAIIDVILIILGLFLSQTHTLPVTIQLIGWVLLVLGAIHLLVFILVKVVFKVILLPFKIMIYAGILIVLVVAYIFLNNAGTFFPLNEVISSPPDTNCVQDSDCKLVGSSCGYARSTIAVNKDWERTCLFKQNPDKIIYTDMFMPEFPSDAKCIQETCTKVREGQTCASYTRDGKSEIRCATCGNGVCEPYEECTSSSINCEGGNMNNCMATSDCGPLHCPQDCGSNQEP